MAKSPTSTPVAASPRPGEGWSVNVQLRQQGQQYIFTADLSGVPVPDKRYSADLCAVHYGRETVRVLFAQEKIGVGLRNLLVINMTPLSVTRFLQVIDDVSKPGILEVCKRQGIAPEEPMHVDAEPQETVSLWATMGMAAMNNRDATIDFFRASPFALTEAPRFKKLSVDPVVRIDTRASLLLTLINELRRVLVDVPELLKQEEVSHE